jgi:hypothetical protein
MLLAVAGFTAFTLANPSPLFYHHPPFPHVYAFEFFCVVAAGFFLGAVSPLFYELSAELTYPSPESTSAAIMTLVNNMVMLVLYTSTPQFDVSNINTLMTCTVGFSLLILLTLTEEYKRKVSLIRLSHTLLVGGIAQHRERTLPLGCFVCCAHGFAFAICSRSLLLQDAGVTHKHHNAGVAAVLQYYSQVEDDEEPTQLR